MSRTRSIYNPVTGQLMLTFKRLHRDKAPRPFSPSLTDYKNRPLVAESRKICMTNERI